MAAPVWGLRPMRALRSAFTSRPMPGMTKTPFFFVSLIAVSASRSRKAATCLLVSSSFSASCRVRAVLVSPVAIVLFSFWAALGAVDVPGLPPRYAYRKGGGVPPMLHLHETPVSMRVRSTRRSLQCGLGQGKVNRKSPFSTNFLGNNAYFAYFCPISPGFRGSALLGRHRRAVQAEARIPANSGRKGPFSWARGMRRWAYSARPPWAPAA